MLTRFGDADAERAADRLDRAAGDGIAAVASSVISGPVSSRPSSSAWPSSVSGRRATASDASRTSAEPEATDSRQPQFGQLPWQGRPFISTTMWPISAPPMIQPR